jgi:hypothetical protein
LASSRKNNPFYTRKELKFNEKKFTMWLWKEISDKKTGVVVEKDW